MKIVLLTIYIGEWPWYFPYFIQSCRYNPTINYIIFTDNKNTFVDLPVNIQLIPYSIRQFNIDASNVLECEIDIKSAYKLCDFKPAYGYIFSDLIKNYNFWGYCDIDIIWGNIRRFITCELLNEYDVISARHDYLTGCFALFRNTNYLKKIFKQCRDYMKVFTEERNFFFDETNFAFEEFGKGIHYSNINTEVESMTHLVKKLDEKGKLKAFFELQIVEGFAGNMLWDHGKLIYRKEFEVMCYHLIKFKRKYSETIDSLKIVPNKFRIGKKSIYY